MQQIRRFEVRSTSGTNIGRAGVTLIQAQFWPIREWTVCSVRIESLVASDLRIPRAALPRCAKADQSENSQCGGGPVSRVLGLSRHPEQGSPPPPAHAALRQEVAGFPAPRLSKRWGDYAQLALSKASQHEYLKVSKCVAPMCTSLDKFSA